MAGLSKLGKFVVGSVVVSVLLSVVAYVVSREDGPHMTPLMEQLTKTATADFATKVPRDRDISTIYLITHGRGNRDAERAFELQLREAVVESDKYRVSQWKDLEDFLEKEQNRSLLVRLRNLFSDNTGNFVEPNSAERAFEIMKQLDAANYQPELDGVLVVDVTDFFEGPDKDGLGAKIGVEAKLWSKRSGKVVAEMDRIHHSIESQWDRRYLRHKVKQWNVFLRFFLWLVICCLIPWGGIQVVRAVLKKRSNGATIGLMAGLVLINLVISWPLVFAFGLSGGTVVGMFFFAALMGYYNYDAVEYINRRLL